MSQLASKVAAAAATRNHRIEGDIQPGRIKPMSVAVLKGGTLRVRGCSGSNPRYMNRR